MHIVLSIMIPRLWAFADDVTVAVPICILVMLVIDYFVLVQVLLHVKNLHYISSYLAIFTRQYIASQSFQYRPGLPINYRNSYVNN